MPAAAMAPEAAQQEQQQQEQQPGRRNFLSARSAAAQLPALSYWEAFFKAMDDLWSPGNPGGHVAMVVAENRLSCDLAAAGLAGAGQAAAPPETCQYNDMRGLPQLRRAIADMLEATFMQGLAIDPSHVTVLAGAGAVIDQLFHAIADPGAGVLVPAPYYPAFDNDLRVRNQLTTIPVHLDPRQEDYGPALDEAAAAAREAGHPVAALLLSHPSNPTGSLYSRRQLAGMVRWCLRNRLHCVSDEIYANSVFGEPPTPWASAAHVAADEARGMEGGELAAELVHVVFGFSKDFCASGWRVGCLHSRSAALNKALDNTSYFASVPCPVQWSLARLLEDPGWLQGFLQENRSRLRAAYAAITGALDSAGIPYQPAAAGMFLWADLSAAFAGGSPSWADEEALWRRMAEQHKVLLTPGADCHAPRPGSFRICWAWPPPESLPTGVQRIVEAMKEHRHAGQARTGGGFPELN